MSLNVFEEEAFLHVLAGSPSSSYTLCNEDDLSKEQKTELEKLLRELNTLAKEVFDDYSKNPSELSGSVTQIHENSPVLDDNTDDTE